MLTDLATAAAPLSRETEVCVIGAGAAGISLARRLLALGHHVVLLESGGRDYERDSAALNAGETTGEPYYELEDARLRFFGGTTAIWGGRCATLDPIDLAKRDWVPHSGWPIGFDTLAPYYRAARPLFGLPSEPRGSELIEAAGVPLPRFDPARLAVPAWTFDRRFNRFAFAAAADLTSHPRCEVVLHATVTSIEAATGGQGIETIEARALGGQRLTVRARAFVLAAGGIETPRLLLASRSVMPSGLGNGSDWVGRCFMEHPHARGGRIVQGDAWALLKAFGRRHRIDGLDLAALIAPAAAAQRDRGLLNSSLTIVARQPEQDVQFWGMRAYSRIKHDAAPTKGARAMWMLTKRTASFAQRHVDPLRPWLLHKAGKLDIALLLRAEQAPNPDSRITLDSARDALGIPRVKLDWRLSRLDVESAAGLVDLVGEELARLGQGRVERASWLSDPDGGWRTDPLISAHPIGGYHHMGTTRMADSPQAGVTDAETRVHGIGNLYIAGSSLFPTSGWANPTLTIVAMALRTGDIISGALGRTA